MADTARGECVACHNKSLPIENGVIARHTNPNPFLSVVCLGTGRPPVRPTERSNNPSSPPSDEVQP